MLLRPCQTPLDAHDAEPRQLDPRSRLGRRVDPSQDTLGITEHIAGLNCGSTDAIMGIYIYL